MHWMGKIPSAACLLLVTVLLAGCGGAREIRPPEGSDRAFVFGNLVIGDKEQYVCSTIYLLEFGVPTSYKTTPQAICYLNGNFFFENIKPGKYDFWQIVAGNRRYLVPSMSKNKEEAERSRIAFVAKPGEVVYVGSFQILGEKSAFFGPGSFSIKRVKKPMEKEILQQLQEETKGTGWDKRIATRLSRMK